jgi:hypothetical protein
VLPLLRAGRISYRGLAGNPLGTLSDRHRKVNQG